ncbi:MAG: flagellar protein [Bacillaceae bacterium]|nr:flagellar protein [Bacillaceae bacterium]
MNNQFKIGQTYFPGQPLQPVRKNNRTPDASQSPRFEQLLKQQVEKEPKPLHFSQHARERLDMRGIELTQQDMDRIRSAVARAEEKGARESLILMNDVAFVVSIKNKTVITAVDGNQMKENIFTNIDSAVVL